MTMYGLSHTSTQGQSQVASGYAKLIDNWDVIEKRYEDIGILTDFERRLFKVVKAVVKHEMNVDFGNAELNVMFEFQFYYSPIQILPNLLIYFDFYNIFYMLCRLSNNFIPQFRQYTPKPFK